MDVESSIYVLSNVVHHFINVVSEEARSVPDSFGNKSELYRNWFTFL